MTSINTTLRIRIKPLITVLSYLVLLMTLADCGSGSQDNAKPQLTIFAAASLTDVFTELADSFESQYDVSVNISFAGSSTLSTQIIEGAQVGLFASANPLQINRLQQEDLIDGQPVPFVSNRIVLVVPTDNPAAIETISDLARPQIKLVLASSGVPIREYTNAVIAALSRETNLGAGFAENVANNVVSEEDNVRQALAKITLGEADAAFVYQTDITSTIEDQVSVIDLPESVQPQIDYLIVTINQSANSQMADKFIQFLTSEQGQCILAQYQFETAQADC